LNEAEYVLSVLLLHASWLLQSAFYMFACMYASI